MKFKAVIVWNLLKKILPIFAGLSVLFLVIAWLAGVMVPKIEPAETADVKGQITEEEAKRINQVHEVTKKYFEEAVGTLKAAKRTEIAARIMAPINEIRVNAGNMVNTGDLLILLDRRDMETRLSQARASLEAAEAAETQAEKDYNRDSELYKEKVIAEARYEQSMTKLNMARAKSEQAQEALAEAEVMLSYTTIAAPQAGTIVDRLAEPGDIARPGVPLLVLYDPASLRLEVPVMENLAVKLKLGAMLTVHVDALDLDVQAHVDEIVPQAEAASRSFLVKVGIPHSEGVYEGMFGRLLIPAGKRRHLCLATAAIRTVGQLQFVDVVKADGRTKERRFITTGRLGYPGRIEVLSGLSAGDRVLLHPEGTSTNSAGH